VKRVLLVCTGNICRSPLAEAMMRRGLIDRGSDHVRVSSAGTGAWEGAPASEGAYLVALEHGLDLSGHRAQLLTKELVRDADLILTMARHHRARVEELGGEGRTHVLGEFAGLGGPEAEISDPFGSDLEVYRDTYEQLDTLIAEAVERLSDERDDHDRGND
jgi:protein-tyrosine-phosphatase